MALRSRKVSRDFEQRPLVGDIVLCSWATHFPLKVKNDPRSEFSNLSNWKEEARKKSALQRDSNP